MAHRCSLVGHLSYVTTLLGLHAFGLLVHNDTLQALSRPGDMFSDVAMSLKPIFATWVQSLGLTTFDLETLDRRVVTTAQELGTADFLVHHIHAFTLHCTVLIFIKGSFLLGGIGVTNVFTLARILALCCTWSPSRMFCAPPVFVVTQSLALESPSRMFCAPPVFVVTQSLALESPSRMFYCTALPCPVSQPSGRLVHVTNPRNLLPSTRFVRGSLSFSDICAQMSRNPRFLQKHTREPSDPHHLNSRMPSFHMICTSLGLQLEVSMVQSSRIHGLNEHLSAFGPVISTLGVPRQRSSTFSVTFEM